MHQNGPKRSPVVQGVPKHTTNMTRCKKKPKKLAFSLCYTQIFATSKRFDWIIRSHVITATKTEKDLNEELKIDTRNLFKPTR